MRIDPDGLARFRLEGALGEGADSEVFAATDAQTERPVVVKRPHPSLIARSQHHDVERRMSTTIKLRQQLGDSLSQVSRTIAYTRLEPQDGYFGDSLSYGYDVVVEERARGLPLVGSTIDGIKRRPIGLPQKLFALHPLAPHQDRDRFTIVRDILEAAEVFHKAGLLLLDVRPQNVFFDPQRAAITIIDAGNVTVERAATRRRAALDMHDFYLELFKWYVTPDEPPSDAAAYATPHGMESVPRFEQDLDDVIRGYSAATWEPLRARGLEVARKVRERGYGSITEFRRDFEALLDLTERRYQSLSESPSLTGAWQDARGRLNDPYWRKFLFDADTDLAAYDATTDG